MFDCIILLYIIYQHQSDPEIPDITWKVSLWFRKLENIISSIPWNLNSVSFVNICHFGMCISDLGLATEREKIFFGDLFWWRFLNQTCRDIMEYYLLMSLLEIVSLSNHFFLSRTVSDPLKIAVLLRHLTQTVSIRSVARFFFSECGIIEGSMI